MLLQTTMHEIGRGTTLHPNPKPTCLYICVLQTTMHEIGLGTTGLNTVTGTARNPHDPWRHTGGSSSGTGALLAAGVVPIGVGERGEGRFDSFLQIVFWPLLAPGWCPLVWMSAAELALPHWPGGVLIEWRDVFLEG